MAFHAAVTTTLQARNYTTSGDVTGVGAATFVTSTRPVIGATLDRRPPERHAVLLRQVRAVGLRARVDVAAWTRPPAVRLLSESPRVLAVSGLARADACDGIVDAARPRLERAQVKDPRTGLTVMGATRTNRVANFAVTDTSVLNLLVQARIAAAAGLDTRMMEAFAVLHYARGEQASEHFDYLDPDVPAYAEDIARYGQRTATALLYLNDDYEGGETAFPELGLRHRGSKGDALIFFSVDPQGRPDPRTVHAGRPPARGEKWVLSQFVRDRPMAPGS